MKTDEWCQHSLCGSTIHSSYAACHEQWVDESCHQTIAQLEPGITPRANCRHVGSRSNTVVLDVSRHGIRAIKLRAIKLLGTFPQQQQNTFKRLWTSFRLTRPCLCVCVRLSVCLCVHVCVSFASDSLETVNALVIKLGTVTASDTRMHHVLLILTLTFIQGHRSSWK